MHLGATLTTAASTRWGYLWELQESQIRKPSHSQGEGCSFLSSIQVPVASVSAEWWKHARASWWDCRRLHLIPGNAPYNLSGVLCAVSMWDF